MAVPRGMALLIIDMQRDFLDPLGYVAQTGVDVGILRGTIAPVRRLLAAARAAGIPVIHTREGHRADLSDLTQFKQRRAAGSGAPIGSRGPLGRLLVRGEAGHAIIPEVAPLAGETVIDKPGFGAFYATDLELILRAAGVSAITIAGVTTDICVHSTLREAWIAVSTALPQGMHAPRGPRDSRSHASVYCGRRRHSPAGSWPPMPSWLSGHGIHPCGPSAAPLTAGYTC